MARDHLGEAADVSCFWPAAPAESEAAVDQAARSESDESAWGQEWEGSREAAGDESAHDTWKGVAKDDAKKDGVVKGGAYKCFWQKIAGAGDKDELLEKLAQEQADQLWLQDPLNPDKEKLQVMS